LNKPGEGAEERNNGLFWQIHPATIFGWLRSGDEDGESVGKEDLFL